MDPRVQSSRKRHPCLAELNPRLASLLLLNGEATIAQISGIGPAELTWGRATLGELVAMGMYQRGLQVARLLLTLGDKHPALPFLHVECLEKNGQLSEAVQTLRDALESPSDFPTELIDAAMGNLSRLESMVA